MLDQTVPMLLAVGAFPIGFGATGTPVGLMVGGPTGYDSTILSLLVQMDKLFGSFPAPPRTALCAGCTANVTNVPVSDLNLLSNSLLSFHLPQMQACV